MKKTFLRKGVALIVVMLIVLSVTAVALVSLQATNTDTRMTASFQYNRQAAQAAHEAGVYMLATKSSAAPAGGGGSSTDSGVDILQLMAEASNTSVSTAMGIMGDAASNGTSPEDAMEQAWNARMSLTKWYKNITPFSGLQSSLSTDSSSSTPLLYGDLSRPTVQVGAIGSPVLNQKQVTGFSNGDAYCSFTMHADSYALIGRSVPLRGSGSNRYYLLADLNARVSGYKREMGLLNAEPMPCNQ